MQTSGESIGKCESISSCNFSIISGCCDNKKKQYDNEVEVVSKPANKNSTKFIFTSFFYEINQYINLYEFVKYF